MSEERNEQVERLKRYAKVIESQTGRAVRPYRADGYVNVLNRYGTDKDTTERYQYQSEPPVGDDTLAEFYEGNGLFATIIDAPAEEAVRHGFALRDVKDTNVVSFFEEALEELDWDETALNAIRWARLFGGSIAVMLINDGRGIDEPLDWKNIQSIDDIRVYERSVVQPDYHGMFQYSPNDPFRTRGSRLGMPEYYDVFSKYGKFRVHESRCLVFRNGVLPENCSNSTYEMWGIPEYIRLKKAIRDAEIAHGNAPKLLEKSVQAVYKMQGLSSLLSTQEGEDLVLKRLQVIDMARGLLNSIAIDSEGEDYGFQTFQFSGIADVVSASCNYLSALSHIPQTILFGQSVGGMSSTDDTSMENWYNFVGRIQKRMLKPNLRYLLSVIFQAGVATGEIEKVPKIKVDFAPLWSLSELEQATLEQTKANTQQVKANTAQIYVSMQAIDPSEVRKKLAETEEFDVENMLDDIEEEDLFAHMELGEETPEQSMPGNQPDLNSNGNSPDAAPAATKLPQDMTDGEKLQKAAKGLPNDENEDSEEPPEGGDPKSVGVVVVSDGKILCGTRHNDFGYGLICGPGGHIEDGETAEEAAIRETEEEFGITPKDLTLIGYGPVEPDTGLTPAIFLCTEWNGDIECKDLEITAPLFRTLEELEQLEASMFQPFKDGIEVMLSTINDEPVTDGGPGSGNYNHKGVPGSIGGSAPSGDSVITSKSFKGGTGDFELTGDVMDMYLTETARARIEGIVSKVKTAADLKDYLSERGIALETSYEPLQQAMDKEIPSVKQQADYIIAAIEEYDELGGLSALKAVHIYEADLDAQAQYSYKAAGESSVEDEGHIYISDLADGFQVMHEFAHAYADSNKPDGMDVVAWSAELNRTAGLSKTAGAYFGANSSDREAERFADAIGHALTTGGDEKLEFVSNVSNIIKARKDGSNLEHRISGESIIPFIPENPIDKSVNSATIKSQEIPTSNADFGVKGMKWGERKAADRSELQKKLVGKKTADGVEIKKVSNHAFDRVDGRGISEQTIDDLMNTQITSPGNTERTRCYEIKNYRMVLDTKSGTVVTVMKRRNNK